jgi:hypothetical protein
MHTYMQMEGAPKGPAAARWRQRKFALFRRQFPLPQIYCPAASH